MKPSALSRRLQAIMRDGNLTVADLARWLERSHPTVREWVRGRAIGGAALDAAYIEALLKKLERLIQKRRGFPVPRMAPSARIAYLADIRRK